MTSEYRNLVTTSRALREKNDCGVKALALATGVSYFRAWNELFDLGRKRGKGTPVISIQKVLNQWGFELVEIEKETRDWWVKRYDDLTSRKIKNRVLAECKTIRTLSRVLPRKGILLILTSCGSGSHILCAKGGQIHDWSQNKCLRVKKIWQVTKGM